VTKIRRAVLPADERGNDPNDFRDDPSYFEKIKPIDHMTWAGAYTLSDSDVDELRDPEWIIEDLVISGHLVIVAAEPNGGKTTIFAHLADEIVAKGYRVFYVNADIAGSDAARFIEQAKAGGWLAMLPDLKPGLSMNSVVENLEHINELGEPLDDVVFIFDTFKKMTDTMNKKRNKEVLALLRSLTGKGATIILLAHTNKYKDAEGKPIYEGTGDIRSDCDELIYLIPQKHPDNSLTVSTEPDKVRGTFKPITFEISPDRKVSKAPVYVDTAAAARARAEYQEDLPDIEVILEALNADKHKQSEIVEHCKGHKISKRTTLKVLRRYALEGPHQQWNEQRALQHNTVLYHRLSEN
jgi:archaellum biogenesis ATPase FlaH